MCLRPVVVHILPVRYELVEREVVLWLFLPDGGEGNDKERSNPIYVHIIPDRFRGIEKIFRFLILTSQDQ